MNQIEELKIENMIYEIRGKQVMLDSDLARLYQCKNGTKEINQAAKNNIEKFPERFSWKLNNLESREFLVKNFDQKIVEYRGGKYKNPRVFTEQGVAMLFGYETKQINRQVVRNIERFPENYCFQLTEEEYKNLRCQIVTSSCNSNYGGRRYLPYAFTEYGITMLAGILKSDVAVKASLKIVNTFILMRKYISDNLIEQKFINEMVLSHDKDIKLLQESFDKLEGKELKNEIYFDGQIYDSYSKIVDIISKAKEELIIIDGYADKIVLDVIKGLNVKAILITKTKSLLTKLDIEKYNRQYDNLEIIYDDTFHDRYFILDKSIVYHCGTSINHIGSKTFSINRIEEDIVIKSLLDKISKLT